MTAALPLPHSVIPAPCRPSRLLWLSVALLTAVLVPNLAFATCPASAPILDTLSCSSSISTSVDHTQSNVLGGECDDGLCYTCGEPYANQAQVAPEAVYGFQCQVSGEVTLLITNLPCDLDIYVLDSSCDPNTGCVSGSTASYAEDDEVVFTCEAGSQYYVVVEAYGTDHLDIASGPCLDENDQVFSPDYTLSFDVSAGTGCPENCTDGLDNDLNGQTDCADVTNCGQDPVCCDLDGDGWFGAQCSGGPDCDDDNSAVYPGASDTVGDNVDQNCDELDGVDEDGDGVASVESGGTDCDDLNAEIGPFAEEIPGNDTDEDCDGVAAPEPAGDDDDTAATGDDDDSAATGDDDDDLDPSDVVEADTSSSGTNLGRGCTCGSNLLAGGAALPGSLFPLLLALGAAGIRRRRN